MFVFIYIETNMTGHKQLYQMLNRFKDDPKPATFEPIYKKIAHQATKSKELKIIQDNMMRFCLSKSESELDNSKSLWGFYYEPLLYTLTSLILQRQIKSNQNLFSL